MSSQIGLTTAACATRRRARAAATDPAQNEDDLAAQLQQMGLYAADTVGDGNCLFRALSDQLYGTPQYHAELRAETCEQLAAHPDLYAGFVETEHPFDVYVRNMRELGTYGGHLELSAFAHLKQKQIRIVQPGLVYVVACDDNSPNARALRGRRERERQRALEAASASTGHARPRSAPADAAAAPAASARELRRIRRAQRTATPPPDGTRLEGIGPLHIVYHNWEHYSSLRSVHGPHTGHPSLAVPTTEVDDNDPEPRTDDEKLISISAPGHSMTCVRRLLRELGDWESVVEELVTRDDACDSDTQSTGSDATEASTSEASHSSLARRAQRNAATAAPAHAPAATPELRELSI